MDIEYPHTVEVRFYPPGSDPSIERIRWAREAFGWGNFDSRVLSNHTEYRFKNEADAVLFALRWK